MKKRFQSITNKSAPVIAVAVILIIWYICCDYEVVPAYMLPSPVDVFNAFVDNFGVMMKQASVTLQEACYGLGIGIALAFIISSLMDRFDFLYKAIYPILVITQTIPTIAIAPLLVLWMGFGMAPKITLVVITTFFPISIGLLNGFKSVDEDAINLMRAMGAGRLQIFRYVKLPNATASFFSGLKISASYAVVGAVISEWLGGFEGLGVYMTRVKKAYAFDKMFAVIVFICAVSLILMGIVGLLQRLAMPWERPQKKSKKTKEKEKTV
ncbi:MAG: ABC transporter permease [Eubacterium sp.]